MCGVAGASLNQVNAATSYTSNNTHFIAPPMGKPATHIAIVAALLSTPLCFIVTLVRLCQVRRPQVADSEIHVIISYFVSVQSKTSEMQMWVLNLLKAIIIIVQKMLHMITCGLSKQHYFLPWLVRPCQFNSLFNGPD